MKPINKKDLFTIPNIICYVRILLIPVFCVVYFNAETQVDYLWAIGIVIFSSFTDLFDGMIARKFNQVTELGKILDPVADKLTHAALALCLAFRYPLMWFLIGLMVIKEGYMAIMGMRFLKHDKMLDGAKWFGKVCTATLFISLCVLFAWYDIPVCYANFIIIVDMIIMALTLFLYIPEFKKMKQELNDSAN